ncbi:MAG: hypothetical protein ACE5DM_02610 [Candidatus Nanoarchaeia archaeon]
MNIYDVLNDLKTISMAFDESEETRKGIVRTAIREYGLQEEIEGSMARLGDTTPIARIRETDIAIAARCPEYVGMLSECRSIAEMNTRCLAIAYRSAVNLLIRSGAYGSIEKITEKMN